MWAAFGAGIVFSSSMLYLWILQEIVDPIPMSLLIGALVGVAFKLFSDAVNKVSRSD